MEIRHEKGKGSQPVRGGAAQSADRIEIDLLELVGVFLNEAHAVIMCALLGALILNAYSYFLIHPTYEAMSKLYIVSASKDSVVDITDLNLGTSLTADYEELIMSYPVLDQVMERTQAEAGISFDDMNAEDFAQYISLENPSNTRLLNIKVETEDPKLSQIIANAVADVSIEYLPRTMSISKPNVAQVAKSPEDKAGPSYVVFSLAGALLGAFAVCAFLTFFYVIDDSLRSGEDLEKEFGVVPLAKVPESAVFAGADEHDDAVIETGRRQGRHRRGRRHS